MLPDSSGRYAALYRPIHMIGLELGVSVASAALRNEPTGAPTGFRSDVAATAKRALKAGEVLDGEGGFCVWGKQVAAERSLAEGLLPLGLAHDVRLKRDVAEGQCLTWSDVAYDEADVAVTVRREMEAAFARPNAPASSPAKAGDPVRLEVEDSGGALLRRPPAHGVSGEASPSLIRRCFGAGATKLPGHAVWLQRILLQACTRRGRGQHSSR